MRLQLIETDPVCPNGILLQGMTTGSDLIKWWSLVKERNLCVKNFTSFCFLLLWRSIKRSRTRKHEHPVHRTDVMLHDFWIQTVSACSQITSVRLQQLHYAALKAILNKGGCVPVSSSLRSAVLLCRSQTGDVDSEISSINTYYRLVIFPRP